MEDKIIKCNRCGFCQEVCPTYEVSKNEGDVARGRIRLASRVCEGNYTWGSEPEIEELIKGCLLCKACVSHCPSAVATDKIMMEARMKINAANGFSLFHKTAYRGVLSNPRRLKTLSGLARFYQRSGARWLVRSTGVLGAVKKVKNMEDLLPPLPRQTFFQQAPDLLKTIANPKFKLGYFVGCATNTFFSQVAVSAVQVLQHFQCQLYVPQVPCCGGPHQSAGDMEEGIRLAKANIDLFANKQLDYLIIDCATCGSTIKEYAELLKDDEEYREKAEEVSHKVKDISQFIMEHLAQELQGLTPATQRVSYHDPCHGVRGLKVTKEPRALIQQIPGTSLIEMKQADWCCGGAGSYCFMQNETAEKILQKKMDNFMETGADVLATSCPACMMQLGHGLRSRGIQAEILHPIEILHRVLAS